MWSVIISVAWIFGLVYTAEASVQCFECTDMPHPSDCEYATTCTSSEQCFVEQFISSGGLVLYNSGCRAKTRCGLTGKRDTYTENGKQKRDTYRHAGIQKREDIIVCQACCDGNFCNDNGCGQPAVQFPQRGLKCYNCKDLINLSECRDLTICQDPSEVCMVHDFIGPDNQPRYETKCERSLVCNALSRLNGKRASSGNCVQCCNKDFCNTHCNGSTGSTGVAATGSTGGAISISSQKTSTSAQTTTTKLLTPTTPVVTVSPQVFCQQHGYLFFGFIPFCFKFHKGLKTRDEAQKMCNNEQGQLAVIDSEQKWDFITKVYSQQAFTGTGEFYIDGKYDTSINKFMCHGGLPCSFFRWSSGQPRSTSTQSCVYLNGTDSMKWTNGICTDRKMFICTKQI